MTDYLRFKLSMNKHSVFFFPIINVTQTVNNYFLLEYICIAYLTVTNEHIKLINFILNQYSLP